MVYRNIETSHEDFEQQVVKRAKEVLSDPAYHDSPLIEEYRELGRNYEKLLRRFYRIATISDSFQNRLKESNQELTDLSFRMRGALESEKRFIASMSHELRTPLNAIIGLIEILRTTPLNEDQRTLIDNAGESSRHLLSLISDVLDISRIDAGELDLVRESFDLVTLLRECIDMVAPLVKEGVSLRTELPHAKMPVIGDKLRLKQIFLNLLGNAAKFTEKGEIRLLLVRRESAGEGRIRVKLCVEDTGIGIAREAQGEIFLPFRKHGSPRYDGTGLGLSISRSLARMMDGDIEVESAEGKGSAFFVSFVIETDPSARSAGAVQRDTSAVNGELATMRVLLVEDLEMNIFVAREMLHRFFGIDPDIARDGAEAVEKVRGNRYDIVFMDIHMPVMDGIEATKTIRKLRTGVPVIGLSADALSTDIEGAKRAGMDDYLTKPVSCDALEAVLRRFAPNGRKQTEKKRFDRKGKTATGEGRERVVAHVMKSYINDRDFAVEMYRICAESVASLTVQVREKIAKGEYDRLPEMLHNLKGVLLQCGLKEEGRKASELEGMAERGEGLKAVGTGVQRLFRKLGDYFPEEGRSC